MGCVSCKADDGGGGSTGPGHSPSPVIDKFDNASSNAAGGATGNSYTIGIGTASPPTGVTYPDSGVTDGRPISPTSLNGLAGTKVYIARFAYQARTTEDLSFEKGERMIVVGPQESDWWMAKSMKSQREGYVPKNYVAEAESYEAEE